eukprot:scaffold14214_cov117-Skeletonema_menzelii.AAC.1
MLSSFTNCYFGCHVSDEDQIAASAVAPNSVAATVTAHQVTKDSNTTNLSSTPTLLSDIYAASVNERCSSVPSGGSDEDQTGAASNSAAADATATATANHPPTDSDHTNLSSTPTLISDNHAVPSDGWSREVGNIFVVEKAVATSPSRSLMDKTFVSSDEYESSQGDEESRGFVRQVDVENKRRCKKILIAKYCFIALFIVIILILVFLKPMNGTIVTKKIETGSPTSPSPSSSPSFGPSITNLPSLQPSSFPSAFPSAAPFVLFTYGESLYTDNDLGIQISDGLTARQIAQTGSRVSFVNGEQSSISYHGMMDGAGIAPLPDGGYAYLSNSEKSSGRGGVYGLYFNKDGQITDYKALLTGSSRNCGGGMSPWNTWISCEEVAGGQCWQVEPDPNKPNHNSPKATLLGGPSGGRYET